MADTKKLAHEEVRCNLSRFADVLESVEPIKHGDASEYRAACLYVGASEYGGTNPAASRGKLEEFLRWAVAKRNALLRGGFNV